MNYKNTSTSQQTFVGKRVVAKTCWRRLEDVFKTSRKTSWRRLGRRKIVTLKTSWRCLEDMSWRRLKTSRRQTKFLLLISVSKKSKCLSNKSLFHKLYLRKLRGIQNPKANPIISIFVLFTIVTEVDEPKTSSLVKPRRWNNFIVKFQNLKQIFIIRANQKKINVKNSLKQIKSNFFSRKVWNKSYQNYYVVRKLRNLIYDLNACYLIHILSYTQNV